MSRVRVPEGALRSADFADGESCGVGAFFVLRKGSAGYLCTSAEPPFPMEKIKPLEYYSYGGDMVDELIEEQKASLVRGLKFLHQMRDDFENGKL